MRPDPRSKDQPSWKKPDQKDYEQQNWKFDVSLDITPQIHSHVGPIVHGEQGYDDGEEDPKQGL